MNWKNESNVLIKTFEFKNFVEVANFISNFTPICEDIQHHPDFKVFDYRFIKFELTTHDTGTISPKDYALSKKLDKIYAKTNEK
jgi:4a-hydroxytetrahydrobiopterin dehydratase